jgi:hypothetical protein
MPQYYMPVTKQLQNCYQSMQKKGQHFREDILFYSVKFISVFPHVTFYLNFGWLPPAAVSCIYFSTPPCKYRTMERTKGKEILGGRRVPDLSYVPPKKGANRCCYSPKIRGDVVTKPPSATLMLKLRVCSKSSTGRFSRNFFTPFY